MTKKKTTTAKEKRPVGTRPAKAPATEDQDDYKSPVEILESVEKVIEGLAIGISKMQKYNAEAQEGLITNMDRMVEHINKQTTVMNDFAIQVQRLTRQQNVFGDIGSVMFEMQSHLEEEKAVMRTAKKELRAQVKEAVHYLDKLRNLLIDLQHYWREE